MPTGTRYQLSLASLFETVFCFAIGLSATIRSTGLEAVDDLESLVDGLGAVWLLTLVTVACSLILGLVRQLRILVNSPGELRATDPHHQFSLTVSVWGRALLIVILVMCTVYKIALTQGQITLTPPEFRDFYHGWYYPFLSNDLSLLAVFAAITFNQPVFTVAGRANKHRMMTILWSLAGILFAMIALRELLVITHLVYLAIAGIENSQAGQYHRTGAYVSQVAENYRFFWVACGALCSLLVGAISWLIALTREKLADRRGFVIVGALGLGLAATYSYWYFTVGYPTLAPEFAEAGMQSRTAHWLSAGVIVTLVIPFIAYRLAVKHDSTPQKENSTAPVQLPFPLGIGMLIFGAIGGICKLLELIYLYIIDQNFGSLDIVVGMRNLVVDANNYLLLAVIFAIWITLWRVWREKNASLSVGMPIVDQRQFAFACLALAIIVPVAIPTIAAFSFASWFNPWFI